MVEMKTEYKGVTIRYSEYDEKFVADFGGDGGMYSHRELTRVRKYIDGVLKRQFEPITALRRGRTWAGGLYDHRRPVEKVTITSVTEDAGVWIKTSKGRREKFSGELFRYTKKNAQKIKTIRKLIKQRDRLDETIREKWSNLDKHDIGKLVKKYHLSDAES